MTKVEIKSKFDEIVDFSGCERYVDTPVKRYSSGMTVRLAFAVAAHLDPEILVVDEVLAVGDAEFQKKAIGKMQDISKGEGRTVLFVSHNMESVSALTKKCILLKNGRISEYGDTDTVISKYFSKLSNSNDLYYINKNIPRDKPIIQEIRVITSHPNNVHSFGEELKVQFKINTPEPLKGAALSFQVTDAKQRHILHLWIYDSEKPILRKSGKHVLTCVIPKSRLYMGDYSLTVHFAEVGKGIKHETMENVCPFSVKMLNFQRKDYPWIPFTSTFIDDFEWVK